MIPLSFLPTSGLFCKDATHMVFSIDLCQLWYSLYLVDIILFPLMSTNPLSITNIRCTPKVLKSTCPNIWKTSNSLSRFTPLTLTSPMLL